MPLAFWAILLLQARTWVLFVMAGASRQQGTDLLALFYPDTRAFWLGLASGVPAALGLLLTGYRHKLPRLWQAWRLVLSASLLSTAGWQALSWWRDDETMTALSLTVFLCDLVALLALLLWQRLRDCFDPDYHAG